LALNRTYTQHAALWRNGAWLDLGAFTSGSGSMSVAYGVNGLDQVVGHSYYPVSKKSTELRAFLWTASKGMVNLGTLGGNYSEAYGINSSGHVAGMARTASGQAHPYLWLPNVPNGTSGSMHDLGGLPGGNGLGWARALNDSDQVVGFSNVAPNNLGTPAHAFLWQGGVMTDLGILPGGFGSDAFAINGAGVIVGSADVIDPSGTSSTGHAVIWMPGQTVPTDLNTLVAPGSGWFLSSAVGINNSGWIVGRGYLNGLERSFLLTPQ
jgi:probable HAF family extracellular repeat protein